MNRILTRQLKKYLNIAEVKGLSLELQRLFSAVSDTYDHFDQDRKLIERSLELSSEELNKVNMDLLKKVEAVNLRTEDLERLNKAMVGRELKMIALKKEIEKLKQMNAGLRRKS